MYKVKGGVEHLDLRTKVCLAPVHIERRYPSGGTGEESFTKTMKIGILSNSNVDFSSFVRGMADLFNFILLWQNIYIQNI